jgi:4-diphosphocytidyl-2-C-methyl-D-erythritol kinase
MSGPIVVTAPAKLTVSLRVTGVRADGYHLLDAEMVTLDLADELTFTKGSGVTMVDEVVGGRGLGELSPGSPNLVTRSLAATGRSAAVYVVKRIPLGAGLGGGSADAAAVLRWAGYRGGGQGDLALAAQLGADVPFCVVGGRGRVTGIGEVVDPLPFEERCYVLVMPPFGVSTAAVYGTWDQLYADGNASVESAADGNDLEEAALVTEPRLALWRDVLGDATGVRPRLAGSGSTWFVEGDLASVGLADRPYLEVKGERGPVVAVRTVPPAGLE